MPSSLLSNRYKVLNVLGDGGFGKTFLVEDTQMPSARCCVLKQLKPAHGETPELRQLIQDRFQREAATLEMLGDGHSQVPCLYAYFSEDEQFYLVQEWIEGQTVAQQVAQDGPQSEQAVQTMVGELLGAITFIHSKGIVHRDIKPDNIILRKKDGKPVLIDFGAVKETMNTTVMSTHTEMAPDSTRSIVIGTPGYMPAEQLSGRPVYASDIYSLGMSAISMLTGKFPQEMVTNPASGQLLWREHSPHVSQSFADFLDTSIHTNSQSRFPTAQAMQSALSALSQTETVVSTSAPTSAPTSVTPAFTNNDGIATTYNTTPASNPTIKQDRPTLNDSKPVSSTRNSPFIIGGIVGLSVLIGAVIVVSNLPKTVDSTDGGFASSEAPVSSTEEQSQPDSEIAPAEIPLNDSIPAEPSPVEPTNAAPVWENMGNAATGESIAVNINSLRPSGDSVEFEYIIGEELIAASADCSSNSWYAESYGWFSPQSQATQAMLNFVCQ